jgi:excisionase family DNA binding protein
MGKIDNFEIYLNHMGAWEGIANRDTYAEYEDLVLTFMRLKGKHIFQSELMEKYKLAKVDDLSTYGNYKQWGKKRRNGEWELIYYCILADYYVQPDDTMYDIFFIYRLRQIDLVELDRFLDYQLTNYYGNDVKGFCRFLKLAMRKNENLLNRNLTLSVEEWMQERKENEISGLPVSQELQERTREPGELPMSIEEAARFLKRKKSTVYGWTSDKTIPHHKKGNGLYFYQSELEVWIKEGKVKSNAEIEGEAATYTLKGKSRR